jgi:putative transposase
MRLMDMHYLKHPYFGARRMHSWLTKDLGYKVSLNRIERLYYRKMALRSVLPGPTTSKRNKAHKVYPYLLRDMKVNSPNQVWATDITYIPMASGFMYLIAVIDLYSRYVVHWSVSNTMDAEWCTEFIQDAFNKQGKPQILNTDQGAQFTSEGFSNVVLKAGVKLSMDGKGRATDNAFIERLWRSVKYEKIYLNPPNDGIDLYQKLDDYFCYYNMERRHSSIDDLVPSHKYFFSKQLLTNARAA